jgi:very-short-patch-repair endonuclease
VSDRQPGAPSSSEEGVGGGGRTREVLLERARQLRNNPTEPEIRLWRELRGSNLGGYKFRRQAKIGNRIADFFCPPKGLIVEIDGDTHDREGDLRRDAALRRRFGYTTIRFTNEDVMRNMDGVLVALGEALERQPDRWPGRARHHPPAPSSEEEGE